MENEWFCYTSKRRDHTAYPATQLDLKFTKHKNLYVVEQEIIFNPSGCDWTMQQWKKSTHGDIAKSSLPLLLSFTRHRHGVQKIYMASMKRHHLKVSEKKLCSFSDNIKNLCSKIKLIKCYLFFGVIVPIYCSFTVVKN